MKSFFSFIILTGFMVSTASAELYQAGLKSRCWAMGGTCMSHVRGSDAVFFNPAALARMDGFALTLAQAQVGASKTVADVAKQFEGRSDFTAGDLDKLYGKSFMADVTGRASFAMPYIGFGVFSNNYTHMKFSDPTFPTFNMDFISDYGYVVAGALPLGKNASLGLAAKHIKRWGGNEEINVSSLIGSNGNSVADQNFKDRGVGHSLDLGFMATLEHPLKPTFSVTWQDLGVTTFSHTAGNKAPPSQYDNLSFGVSLEHELMLVDFTHAFEYKFIRTDSGDDLSRKLHLGTEASFGLINLRAGLNQGYVTYGAGIDLWILQVDAAAYANELGTYAGQARSDNYHVSVTLSLDFDQSFKLQDSAGKKRRLKQRR